jgi:hypothetical protein
MHKCFWIRFEAELKSPQHPTWIAKGWIAFRQEKFFSLIDVDNRVKGIYEISGMLQEYFNIHIELIDWKYMEPEHYSLWTEGGIFDQVKLEKK